MNDLMLIGEFSEVTGVSKRMLRHYDKLGLITPKKTDDYNGYRYYDQDQLPVIHTITALQNYGFSLSKISHMMDEGITVEDFTHALKDKEIHLRRSIDHDFGHLLNIQKTIAFLNDHYSNTAPGLINLRHLDLERSHPMTTKQPSPLDTIKDIVKRLPTEALFSEQMEALISKNTSDLKYFITFDLDHFAAINDLFGYDVGDAVIYQSFEIIFSSFQGLVPNDHLLISRFGGDEIAIYIENLPLDTIQQKTTEVLDNIQGFDFSVHGCQRVMTSSCGIYNFITCDHIQAPRHESAKAFMNAKRQGGNTVVVVQQED